MHQRGEWRDFSKPRKCSSHPFGLLLQYFAWCLHVKLLLLLKDRRFGLRLKRVHLAVGSDVLAEQVLSLVLSDYCWSMLPRATAAPLYRARKYGDCDLHVLPVTLGQLINFLNQIYIMQIVWLLFAEVLPHSYSLHLMHSQRWPEGIML